MKIGVLGGSFNPPHLGHILLATWALAGSDLDQIIIIPCHKHPFEKKLINFKHRYKMCKLAFKKFGDLIKVSDIERRLGMVNRTLLTLRALSKRNRRDKFVLVVGSDILKEKNKWYRMNEIERDYGIIVIQRGRQKEGMYIPDISSSDIRRRIKKGLCISDFVPKPVAQYIKKTSLFK